MAGLPGLATPRDWVSALSIPGLRTLYSANCYAGIVFDPDGHMIEAVCHSPD